MRRVHHLSLTLYCYFLSATAAFRPSLPSSRLLDVSGRVDCALSAASIDAKTEHTNTDSSNRNPNRKKKKKNKISRTENESLWLRWVYYQWKDCPPGQLDKSVLKNMVPSIALYSKRRSLEAAEQAETVLNRYIDEYLAGNSHAKLTITLFNTAMNAYAKIGRPEDVARIIHRMQELTREQDHNLTYLQLDVISLTTLATAWTRSGKPESLSKAEGVLHFMERHDNVQPTTVAYNVVLNALAHSTAKDKAARAEALVKRMEHRSQDGHSECAPTIVTYQTLLSAWSRCRTHPPQKAEELLTFLDQQATDHNKPHLAPNTHCYAAAIHAWANSRQPDKAQRAYDLLQQLRNRYEQNNQADCRPNVVVYTAVINACASPVVMSTHEHDESSRHAKKAAFDIAQTTLEELDASDYGPANFLTYAAFLRVCATTLPPGDERDVVVRRTFDKCCHEGQLGKIVLDKLTQAASPEVHAELFPNDSASNFPSEWQSNVQGERSDMRP